MCVNGITRDPNALLPMQLVPPLADVGGGTLISVSGEGFPPALPLWCDFGSQLVPAMWLTEAQLTCPGFFQGRSHPPGGVISMEWAGFGDWRWSGWAGGSGLGYHSTTPPPQRGPDNGRFLGKLSGSTQLRPKTDRPRRAVPDA